MSESDNIDGIYYWVESKNKNHGYGGEFNSNTADDKCIVERSTASEWVEAIKATFHIQFEELEHNPSDPPDFFISLDGKRLKVELVQLIEQDHLHRASKNESPHFGQLFLDMQWSAQRLEDKLNKIISDKGDKYDKKGLSVDVLVIHTAEPWLNSSQAQQWLNEIEITPHPNILNASLFFDYEPVREHWPLIWLYGNIL